MSQYKNFSDIISILIKKFKYNRNIKFIYMIIKLIKKPIF